MKNWLILLPLIALNTAATVCLVQDQTQSQGKVMTIIDSYDQLEKEVSNLIQANAQNFDEIYFSNSGEDVAVLVLAKKTKNAYIQMAETYYFQSGKLYISETGVLDAILKSDSRIKAYPVGHGCPGYLKLVTKKDLDKIVKIDIEPTQIELVISHTPNSKTHYYIVERDLMAASEKLIKRLVQSGDLSATLIK